MKTLDTGVDNPQWSNSLVHDLSFIRKHLRYPFSRKTLVPALMLGVVMAGVGRMFALVFMIKHIHKLSFISNTLLIILFLATCICICVFGYMRLLRFMSVHTPYGLTENIKLLPVFNGTKPGLCPAPGGAGSVPDNK